MRFAYVLYPGVEPIDLAALGVVSMARRVLPELGFVTVAATAGLVELANGLRVAADHAYADCPPVDVVIVPGGPGWVAAAGDADLLAFLRDRAGATSTVSLCTGAMVLAAAGLLDGLPATTKVEVLAGEATPLTLLAERHPSVQATCALVVDTGHVITGGGVSLCIDTMLYLLRRTFDAGRVDEIERVLEYGAAAEANRRRLPIHASQHPRSGRGR
jgi:transcriptional regulator GlxA family with amidase domain